MGLSFDDLGVYVVIVCVCSDLSGGMVVTRESSLAEEESGSRGSGFGGHVSTAVALIDCSITRFSQGGWIGVYLFSSLVVYKPGISI